MFEAVLFAAAVAAGSIAAVVGFGIGSVLTPLLALRVDTRLAVAAIALPHFIGTAYRFWLVGKPADRRVLLSFGAASAIGGLTGALLHGWAASPALTIVFGCLVAFTSASEWLGWARRMRFHGAVSWTAGTVSGLLGGLVGNQGGIRSAALLGFDLDRQTFVATATAIGLVVDAARMPVYVWQQWRDLEAMWGAMAIATAGVVIGTVLGTRLLVRIPEPVFRRIVATVLAALGIWMIVRGVSAYGA